MTETKDDASASAYQVVVNDEGQYSIWANDREPPLGWRSVQKNLTRAGCLAYIESTWTDMRPLSLRKKMEGSD
jgi:MbtH protein